MEHSLKSIFAPVCLLILTIFAVSRVAPQSAGLASAPPEEFSSNRAMTKLQVIASKPHPLGVPAHDEVRDYLLRELSALGVNAEVQTTTSVSQRGGTTRAALVQNIVARLAGTNSDSKALLLTGHYDSAPASYGAGDDGSAVASMLEILRALKHSAPLRNDVVFLFTDGEEAGLLGAEAFVREYPLAKNIGLVLNMEARGYKGPSIMFETSPQNGRIISEFAGSAPHPVATSMAYEIYKLLPNDTDLSIFKEAGVPGLNFAFIEGATHYHTALDNFENIDERSLQQQGSNVLALTRHFGNLDLANLKANNAIYFDILGLKLIHYPSALVTVFSALTAIGFIGVVIIAFRRGLLRFSRIVLAFFAFLLCLIGSVGVTFLLWQLVNLLHRDYSSIPQGFTYNGNYYVVSFVALTVAITAGLFLWFRRKLGHANVAIGSLCWWLILMILTSLFLPGFSYLFTWPLFFGLIGIGYDFYAVNENSISVKRLVVLVLTAAPVIILFVPVIYMMTIALPLWLSAGIMVIVTLAVGLLLSVLNDLAGLQRGLVPLAAIGLALIAIAIGSLTSGFNRKHPRFDSLLYGLNADTGKAMWATRDAKTDSWSAQFFHGNAERNTLSSFLPSLSAKFLQQEAQAVPLNGPEATVLSDNTNGDTRTLRLRINSPRQAAVISLYVEEDTRIQRASLNGKEINVDRKPSPSALWSLRYYAAPPAGLELTLEMTSTAPVRLRVVDQSYGLPKPAVTAFQDRPEDVLAMPYYFNDSTFVSKSFVF